MAYWPPLTEMGKRSGGRQLKVLRCGVRVHKGMQRTTLKAAKLRFDKRIKVW